MSPALLLLLLPHPALLLQLTYPGDIMLGGLFPIHKAMSVNKYHAYISTKTPTLPVGHCFTGIS